MNLNDAGLPLPGRELDAWICRNILNLNVVHDAWPCGYEPDCSGIQPASSVSGDWETDEWLEPEFHPVYLPEHGTWPPQPYDWGPHLNEYDSHYCFVKVCPFVSTTHAFFQVMDAMEKQDRLILLFDHGMSISTRLVTRKTAWPIPGSSVMVGVSDYPDREHAWAHAVCAWVWKAEHENTH